MVDWRISEGLTPYPQAIKFIESRARAIAAGEQRELVWLLEHPAIYTSGTSAVADDLIDPDRFPVYKARRGGQYTYHGPGQRVIYAMLHVGNRGRDIRRFVNQLEEWVISTLAEFDVIGERRKGRVGVWVQRKSQPPLPDGSLREDKIAAIGVRLHKWVSFHGISINLSPNLSHYDGIVPCGIDKYGVTSLTDLGLQATMADLDLALKKCFLQVFE